MENHQLTNQNKEWSVLKIGSLTQFETQVVACSTELKIATASDKQISDMYKEIFLVLGINKIPAPLEKLVLIERTKSILGNYTIADIKTAIDLALRNIIEFSLNLYDRTFSISFIADLMNRYEVYRAATMFKYRAALEEQKEKERQKEKTPEEIKKLNYEAVKSACIDLFERCKNTSIRVSDVDISNKGIRYGFLKSLKLLSYTQEQIDNLKIKANHIIANEALSKPKKENPFKAIVTTPQSEQEKLNGYIKNLMVLDYIKYLIVSNRDLKAEIERAEKEITKI